MGLGGCGARQTNGQYLPRNHPTLINKWVRQLDNVVSEYILNIDVWKFQQESSLMWKSLGTDAIIFNFQLEVLLKDLYVRKTQLLELDRGCLFRR